MSGPVELQCSLGSVLYDLHKYRLVGYELVAHGHHVREVLSRPHLDIVALEVLQFLVVWLPITYSPYQPTEGSSLQLEVDCLGDVSLARDSCFLYLALQIIPGILKIGNIFGTFEILKLCVVLSFSMLHLILFLPHVVQRFSSIGCLLLTSLRVKPSRRLILGR